VLCGVCPVVMCLMSAVVLQQTLGILKSYWSCPGKPKRFCEFISCKSCLLLLFLFFGRIEPRALL
jgi:hypothetical protein